MNIENFSQGINLNKDSILIGKIFLGALRKHCKKPIQNGLEIIVLYNARCGIYHEYNSELKGMVFPENLKKIFKSGEGIVGDLIIHCNLREFSIESRHVKVGKHGHPFKTKGNPCICYENVPSELKKFEIKNIFLKD